MVFPSGTLLKHPGTPLSHAFWKKINFIDFFFQSTFYQSPHPSFYFVLEKKQNFHKLPLPTQSDSFCLGFWRKCKQAHTWGCCRLHPGSGSSEEKIHLDFLRFNLAGIKRKPGPHLLLCAAIWQKYRKLWFFIYIKGEHG